MHKAKHQKWSITYTSCQQTSCV